MSLRVNYTVLHGAHLMNLKSSLLLILSTSLFAITGCAADAGPEADADDSESEVSEDAITNATNSNYWVVTRRDFRRCMAPLCGGYYVKRVNRATTVCADGKPAAECYVGSIGLNGMDLSAREEETFRGAIDSGRAVMKARLYKTRWNGNAIIGTLKANEGWIGATGSAADGTFFRVFDNGIRCIKAPCPSTTATALNGGDSYNVIKVGLTNTATPASQESLDRASSALGTKEGILLAGGVALPKCVPNSNCGPFVNATEFYLRFKHTEGVSCGGHTITPTWCNDGQFCNWQPGDICGAADAPGKCAYKPEVCNKMFAPVCGCDGKTYGNSCMANAAGMSVSSNGACGK